uniref:hypothetical protein n=1 Tax=Parabacteroides distasonis TaxID=823 RepID=UPI004026A8B5
VQLFTHIYQLKLIPPTGIENNNICVTLRSSASGNINLTYRWNRHTDYEAWWNDRENNESFHPHHHVYMYRIKWKNQRKQRIWHGQLINKA